MRIHEFMFDSKKFVLDVNEDAILEPKSGYYKFPSV